MLRGLKWRGHGTAARPSAIRRLLVPLDGSVEAASAIDPALRIARSLQVPVELMTVHEPVHGTWARDIDDTAAGLLYEHVEVAVVGAGWAGDVIVEAVAEHPGTVVCMATHSRDRFSRLVAGSVTEHVLRHAEAPVVMVGPRYLPGEAEGLYERAVVCCDGGHRDEVTLAAAESWARQLKLELELVHVLGRGADDGTAARISDAAVRLEENGLAARATVTTGADPAESLIELFAQRPGALAVLVSHARVGLPRIVLGSVSSKMLEASPIPLLLTRVP
ncbi:universal stress protein [Nocardiopsis valliformis]|uniref:universal stress protein n=1 Tax=Nocardiopsis valliformis TaxID=239974 RepID=UPI0003452381|nr:universal stress protein [Nocardiopsis valliformis]